MSVKVVMVEIVTMMSVKAVKAVIITLADKLCSRLWLKRVIPVKTSSALEKVRLLPSKDSRTLWMPCYKLDSQKKSSRKWLKKWVKTWKIDAVVMMTMSVEAEMMMKRDLILIEMQFIKDCSVLLR